MIDVSGKPLWISRTRRGWRSRGTERSWLRPTRPACSGPGTTRRHAGDRRLRGRASETAGRYIPPLDRVAVFDNDGTLWCEKPMPVELGFILRRLCARCARAVRRYGKHQPFKAAYDKDYAWLGEAMTKHYHGDDNDLNSLIGDISPAFAGCTWTTMRCAADEFLDGRHPTLGRSFRERRVPADDRAAALSRSQRLHHYIASAATVTSCARSPRRSTAFRRAGHRQPNALSYRRRARDTFVYLAQPDVFDDGPAKPVRIWSRIGRRPIVAAATPTATSRCCGTPAAVRGRCCGCWCCTMIPKARIRLLSGAETSLERAAAEDWTVVSIKRDWATVFA